MTIQEIISSVDGVKPNAYDDEEKLRWINELERRIETNVYDKTDGFTVHESTDEDTLLGAAWDDLYKAYLTARIASANGEYSEYANLINDYNEMAGEFQRWYCRHYVDID